MGRSGLRGSVGRSGLGGSVGCGGLGSRVWDAVVYVVERWAFGRGNRGSKPPTAVSKLRWQSHSPHFGSVFRKRH